MRYGPPNADDGGDSCYVKDCAIGIQLAHMAPTLEHRVYNIGAGKSTRNREMIEAIRKIVPEFQADLPAGGNADNKYMDISRISSELGYKPETGPERGLAEYVEWLRSHPQ
jgi:nucleoside-diphosphate-sugar epimerase